MEEQANNKHAWWCPPSNTSTAGLCATGAPVHHVLALFHFLLARFVHLLMRCAVQHPDAALTLGALSVRQLDCREDLAFSLGMTTNEAASVEDP